jgi:hypothetical protein
MDTHQPLTELWTCPHGKSPHDCISCGPALLATPIVPFVRLVIGAEYFDELFGCRVRLIDGADGLGLVVQVKLLENATNETGPGPVKMRGMRGDTAWSEPKNLKVT